VARFLRLLSAFVAIVSLSTVVWGSNVGVSRAEPAPARFVIEVSAAGFNPQVCKISRGDQVFFKNADSKPHRVIWADPNGGAPLFDSGLLASGATTTSASADYNFPSRWVFQDADDLSHKTTVITPTLSNSWTPDCTPERQAPPPVDACAAAVACVRAPGVAADR
jgi:plastocyanin